MENNLNIKELLDIIYPIGSIYISVNDLLSPSEFIGGYWDKIEKGYALWTCSKDAWTTIPVEYNLFNRYSSNF